ncbi:MAG: DUF881 domain-containing protein [Bacillota bacterium]|nr:DUF881 domain-containing protein [Bacillota bacterium]
MKNKVAVTLLTLLCFILGLAISIQYHSKQATRSDLTYQSNEDLLIILNEMNKNRSLLEQQWLEVQSTLQALKEENIGDTVLMKQLENANRDYATVIGDREISGPGLRITFEKTEKLMGTNFIDLLNELWGTGAEAIAVNGIRIDGHASFATTQKGDIAEITLNNTPLDSPIIVEAIGSGEDLSAGLNFPGGIMEQLNNQYGIVPTIEQVEGISLPAVS